MLQHRVRRETGAQNRVDVRLSPVEHPNRRFPERFPGEIDVFWVGAGDDQRIEALLSQIFERLVVLVDMLLRFFAAILSGYGKWIHVKIGGVPVR